MSSAKVRETLEAYFSSMNSISRKLMEDVKHKAQGWSNLSYEEQSDFQWRSLVERSVEEKYETLNEKDHKNQCFPVLIIESGEKLVIDEDTSNGRPFGSSWKDEHSSPFSWETKSQLNLHLLVDENIDNPDGAPRTPKTPKTPPSMRSFKKYPTPKSTPRSSPKPSPALTRKQALDKEPTAKPSSKQTLNSTVETPRIPDTSVQNLVTDSKSSECVLKEDKIEKLPEVIRKEQPKDVPVLPESTKNLAKSSIQPPKKQIESIIPVPNVPVPIESPEIVPVPVESPEEDAVSETSSDLDLDNPGKFIPKTGFDFLDNW